MERVHPWETASSTSTPLWVSMDTPCMHSPIWKYLAGCPSWCCEDELCSQVCVGRQSTSAHGQVPHAPCVSTPAGAPYSALGVSHWEQEAGRLVSRSYFPENIWEHKELFSAFKCVVSCDHQKPTAYHCAIQSPCGIFFSLKKKRTKLFCLLLLYD